MAWADEDELFMRFTELIRQAKVAKVNVQDWTRLRLWVEASKNHKISGQSHVLQYFAAHPDSADWLEDALAMIA
jgi:hypothetical protein